MTAYSLIVGGMAVLLTAVQPPPADAGPTTESVDTIESVVETEFETEVETIVETEVETDTEIEEDPVDETIISPEEDDQSDDLSDSQYTVSDNNSDPYIDNNIDDGDGSDTQYTVSGNEYIIVPYSDYDGYDGVISDAYLQYFRGLCAKLSPSSHYVCARTGQYTYIFASGNALTYDRVFSGTDITVTTINTRYDLSISTATESTFTFDPSGYMCYSDLSDVYPALTTVGDLSLRQIVFVIAIAISFYTVTSFLKGGRRWVRRRKHVY